jgi:hypothetical protein
MRRMGIALYMIAAVVLLSAATSGDIRAQSATGATSSTTSSKSVPTTFISLVEFAKAKRAGGSVSLQPLTIPSPSSAGESQVTADEAVLSSGNTLPLWSFNVRAARDGHHHRGVMVGTNPFTSPGTSKIPTQIVPLVLHLHSVGVSFDPNTGIITTTPGEVTVDPTDADNSCMSAPNNVPATVLSESPIFNPAKFTFGSTNLGTTQYIDAFQRANFYQVLGADIANYHVLLDPVNTLRGVEINVPAAEGIAITDPAFLSAAPFGLPPFCAPLGLVDFAWLDFYLNDRVLPDLAEQGVNATTLPIFMLYSTWEAEPVNQIFSCCIGGYHSFGGFPVPAQTYSVANFDSTGVLGPSAMNTVIISHEVGEWVNDPYGTNLVPPWTAASPLAPCQANLEVGDPLTGTNIPPVTMDNGFIYGLQELAFFSWFFGGKSIGVNGWYSNNGTFLTVEFSPCIYQ